VLCQPTTPRLRPFSLPCAGGARFLTRTCTPSMINVSSPLYKYTYIYRYTPRNDVGIAYTHETAAMLYYFVYSTTDSTETRCDVYTTDNFTRRFRSCIFCDDDIIYYYVNVKHIPIPWYCNVSYIMLARLPDRELYIWYAYTGDRMDLIVATIMLLIRMT